MNTTVGLKLLAVTALPDHQFLSASENTILNRHGTFRLLSQPVWGNDPVTEPLKYKLTFATKSAKKYTSALKFTSSSFWCFPPCHSEKTPNK